jgi:dTDP-4-dehydrorhamnose reductase
MFIENFDRIYGEYLYTRDTMYLIEKDTMMIAPNHHILRINPTSGKGQNPMTIVLMKSDKRIKMGVYHDTYLNPIAIKDIPLRDIKRFENFKTLLATTIETYE